MTDELTEPPASLGSEQIVLHGLEEVEYVTSALSVYIDHLVGEHGNSEPHYMKGPWMGQASEGCEHTIGDDITEEADKQLRLADEYRPERDANRKVFRCNSFPVCKAYVFVADALDAVRETAKGAIELRQRIVKEWGYDPTHES